MEAIENRVLELLSVKIGENPAPTLETRILADTTMDSVHVMDFLLELEDEFDITISLNRLANVETVADLVNEVHKVKMES